MRKIDIMKKLAIISTGHAGKSMLGRFGDFTHWFRHSMRRTPDDILAVDAIGGADLPAPETIRGAIITGSACMVTDHADWSENLAGWIRTAMDADMPLLGVCYGHQLMAYALGGKVGDADGGLEIGSKRIQLQPEAGDYSMTRALPSTFMAQTYHSQSVLEIPATAQVLASSVLDPHHILRYSDVALSVQFHPEFSVEIMRALIHQAKNLEAHQLKRRELLAATRAAPHARALLRQFERHTRQHAHKQAVTAA